MRETVSAIAGMLLPCDRPEGGPRTYHHGDLSRALIVAGRHILETQGPAALSLRAVARQAGVSPAAPYHHFKDKSELLDAVASEGWHALGEAISNANTYVRRAFGSTAFFAILCALVMSALRDWRLFDRATRHRILWCSAVFMLAYAPITETRFAAEYYFLAPLSFLLLLGAITLIHYRSAQPTRG